MDVNLARSLLPVVNTPDSHDALMTYAVARREALKEQLVHEQSVDRIRSIQGQLAEVARLLTLRDEAISVVEESKNRSK